MVKYLRAANVKDGVLDLTDVKEMNFSPHEQGTFALRPGDVLVTEGSGSLSAVGASAVWGGEISGIVCFQNTLIRLRPRDNRTDGQFLGWWARAAFSSGQFASIASGANIYHISAERVKSLPISLPSREEQRRIVNFLDAETARIEKLDRMALTALGLLRERRESMLAAIIGTDLPLGKLYRSLRLLRDGSHQPPDRVASGIPLLTARNVSSGTLKFTKYDTFVSEEDAVALERSLRPAAGDVLLSVKGTVGAVAIIPSDFPRVVLDRNLALLRSVEGIRGEWLVWTLRSRALQEQIRLSVTAAAQPGLPLSSIRELRIPLCSKAAQDRRLKLIEAADGQVADLERAFTRQRELLAEHRRALITVAVNGQIDVTTARGADLS